MQNSRKRNTLCQAWAGIVMDEQNQRAKDRSNASFAAMLRSDAGELSVTVRNLSEGGAMIEGARNLSMGIPVSVQIPNIGWVEGSVVWALENRCGIAFRDPIDPRAADLPL